MKFRSTHQNDDKRYSFAEAILVSFDEHGGFLLPDAMPLIDTYTLNDWKSLPFIELAFQIWRLFLDESEISSSCLTRILEEAYSDQNFSAPPSTYGDGVVNSVNLERGGPDNTGTIVMMELFHGRSKAFKDFSTFVAVRLIKYFDGAGTALVATSGDTGSSCLEACLATDTLGAVVLLPGGSRISAIQRLQMGVAATKDPARMKVLSMDRTSDELDVICKPFFRSQTPTVFSMNSINVGRLLGQIPHIVFSYFEALRAFKTDTSFLHIQLAIPTGGGGNLASALLAKRMIPYICPVPCVNANDSLHRLHTTGVLKAGPAKQTLASAMDMQLPYNLARVLFSVSMLENRPEFETSQALCKIDNDLASSSAQAKLPEWLWRAFQKHVVVKVVGSDDTILESMRWCRATYNGYLACPHTAVALTHCREIIGSHHSNERKVIACLSPASHFKFPEAMKKAFPEDYDETIATTSGAKAWQESLMAQSIDIVEVPFGQESAVLATILKAN